MHQWINDILLAAYLMSNLFLIFPKTKLPKYDWHSIMVCNSLVLNNFIKSGWLRNLKIWDLSCSRDRPLNRTIKLGYICYWLIATLPPQTQIYLFYRKYNLRHDRRIVWHNWKNDMRLNDMYAKIFHFPDPYNGMTSEGTNVLAGSITTRPYT